MRICYVAPDVAIPFASGASVHVSEISSNLASLGHEVHVICRRVRPSDPAYEYSNGVNIHRIYRWIFRAQRRSRFTEANRTTGDSTPQENEASRSQVLNRVYYAYLTTVFAAYVAIVTSLIVRKFRVDAILERESSFGAGGLASLWTGKPMILEIIGPRYSRLSAWRSKKILYYTDTMLRSWVDRNKCIAVPGGVNTRLFRRDEVLRDTVRRRLDFREGDFVVGYIGSFQEWHGIDTLIAAIAIAHRQRPQLKGLLVGPSSGQHELNASRMGLEGTLRFVGAVPYEDVPGYINACEIMVAPYDPSRDPLRMRYGIGWPLKILEYMACERPVIATRVPPIDKIISSPDLGLLVLPGSAGGLAGAMDELVDDEERRGLMGLFGSALVRNAYTWQALASTISALVQSSSQDLRSSRA